MSAMLGVLFLLAPIHVHQSQCTTPEQPARLFCATPQPNTYDYCRSARITGYVRGTMSPLTYDGTSILTAEPIAAASFEIPINSIVDVDGIGVFRVADRGRLGSDGWIDIATWSREEAMALTGQRTICVTTPRR